MRRFAAALITLTACHLSYGDSLTKIESSPHNKCAEYGCMYYEWSLASQPDVRLIISGYEDGLDRNFYVETSDGALTHLIEVHPIVKDSEQHYWWGYPWTIGGLPHRIENEEVVFWATFDHAECDDGEHRHPEWQLKVPVVLFDGKREGWNVARPAYDFHEMTLKQLVEESKKPTDRTQPCHE